MTEPTAEDYEYGVECRADRVGQPFAALSYEEALDLSPRGCCHVVRRVPASPWERVDRDD